MACSSGSYDLLGLLASRLFNLTDRSSHFSRVVFFEAHDSLISFKMLSSILINSDHFVHLGVQLLILLLNCLCMLCQVQNVFFDAHLSHDAIIL